MQARRSNGFRQTGALVSDRVKSASQSRGFNETRLLTHWAEIAGTEIAGMCRPVEVKYSSGSFGATLVLLTTGPHAPILKMQETALRAKVNACYGYNAIARIRLTQTAPIGFADGQVQFGKEAAPTPRIPSKAAQAKAVREASDVQDDSLRAALEKLGANIISKQNSTAGE